MTTGAISCAKLQSVCVCVCVQLYCQRDAGPVNRGAVELALQSLDVSSSAVAL